MGSVLTPIHLSANVSQTPVGPEGDSELVWFLPMAERVVRGEALRYSIVISDLWQSNQALGLGGLVASLWESRMLPVHLSQTSQDCREKRVGKGWIKQKEGLTKGSGMSSPTVKGRRLFC